jgi:hypothetical protein
MSVVFLALFLNSDDFDTRNRILTAVLYDYKT